jgi:putative heme transporter
MNATSRDELGVQDRKVLLRITQAGFPVAILVAIFGFAVPKFARYASVWAVLQGLTWSQLVLLVAATLFSLVVYWPVLVASLPGLTLAQAAVNNQATTSIANTLPGGGVVAIGVGYVMLRSWGFTTAEVTLSTLVTGIWNSFGKLAMPIFAVAILALTGGTRVALLLPALAGVAALVATVVVFGLLMWKQAFAQRIGAVLGCCASWLRRPLGRPPVSGWGEAAVRFRRQSNELVARRWPALSVMTVASHIGLYLVFLFTIRLVGITPAQVSSAEVLGVFSLGRLLTAAPITPGGVGVAELTYSAGLVLAGGGGRGSAAVPPADLRAANPSGRRRLPDLAAQDRLAQAGARQPLAVTITCACQIFGHLMRPAHTPSMPRRRSREAWEGLDRVAQHLERDVCADGKRRLLDPLTGFGPERVGADQSLAVAEQRQEPVGFGVGVCGLRHL